MERCNIFLAASLAITLGTAALAEPISVRHIQRPMRRFMVARSAGKIIASGEFSQVVQGDEVTMRLTYKFVDGSIDDETTTYRQQGTFRLVRNHHIEKGPFFVKPVDFTVEAATDTATSRTADKNGKIHVESHHIDLPDDLANGFVGTLLLNLPQNAMPFRVGMLAPVSGGRLIQLLIFFFFNDTATTEIYTVTNTLSLHDALPIYERPAGRVGKDDVDDVITIKIAATAHKIFGAGNRKSVV
jgi:hypothetical protein